MEDVKQFPKLINKDFETSKPEKGKEIRREDLVNKLNYINFQDDTILINFKHRKYDQHISLQAKPKPCTEHRLSCIWVKTSGLKQKLKGYTFQNLHIPDGQKLLMVQPEVLHVTNREIEFRLPEKCLELRTRKIIRYECENIQATLIQNSVVFSGKLVDFSAYSLCVELQAEVSQSFQWINPLSSTGLIITDGDKTIYSGDCKILRQTAGKRKRTIVLEPISNQIQRFKPRKYRSFRYCLEPQLDLMFHHPCTHRSVSLKVVSLSGTGFSVEEIMESATLLPGIIIPKMELRLANNFKIQGKAQVIHRTDSLDSEDNDRVRCGLAFLDMDFENHSKLLGLLNQAKDKYSYFCDTVDMDALWKFFFDSGFIYPKKYAYVHANKDNIKASYEKLYTQHPAIARHFIYQVGGRILGHMSMLRFYENSWIGHHHASDRSASTRAGLDVLSQMNHFLNDAHNFISAHIDRIFCFYRPGNKFPHRVLGGAARFIKDPQKLSLDNFVYLHFHKQFNNYLDMPNPWELKHAQPEDLSELESFYRHCSGGQMLKAFGIMPNRPKIDEVSLEFKKHGFKLEKHLFSLKKDGVLKAVAFSSISDTGLNLSDLINCIYIFVIDQEGVPRETLDLMLSLLSQQFEQDNIPVLLYPEGYVSCQSMFYEKLYTMWVLDLNHVDAYLKFINRLLRAF